MGEGRWTEGMAEGTLNRERNLSIFFDVEIEKPMIGPRVTESRLENVFGSMQRCRSDPKLVGKEYWVNAEVLE